MKWIHFIGSGQPEAKADISAMVYMKSNNLKQNLASTLKGKEQKESQGDERERKEVQSVTECRRRAL